MKIIIRPILLASIIFLSKESACPNGASSCNFGDSCSLKTYVDKDEDLFCDFEKEILCDEVTSLCVCYNDFSADFYSDYNIIENKCCLNHETKCLKKPEFLFHCCHKEECVLNNPDEYEGKCQCVEGYTFNSTTNTCQKTAYYEQECNDYYDICTTGLICDDQKKKCMCPPGKTYSNNECINVVFDDSDSKEISNVIESSSKIINFNILFLIVYLLVHF